MRLRHRVDVLVGALLAAGLAAMALLAGGLLHQAVNEAAAAATGGQLEIDRLWEAVAATDRVLWLAAGALLAALLGLGAAFTRVRLLSELEDLDRRLTRDHPEYSSDSGDEVSRLAAGLRDLDDRLRQASGDRQAGLSAVAVYRDAVQNAARELAVADRLALTGQLALGVAHEVGNPLAVAQAALDTLPLLDADADADERVQTLRDAAAALTRIDAVLRDMNAFGLDADSADNDGPTDCNIADAVAAVRALGRLHNKIRHAEIDVQPDSSPSETHIAMPPGHLEQVLLNLVINAADATDGRGPIHIAWQRLPSGAAITVQDAGPGVAPGELERVFEPFVTSKALGSGSGLGLAVSRQLVRAAGGSLTASRSESLGGACFRVEVC